MKKFLSLILALAMISMAFTAFAVEVSESEAYYAKYEIEDAKLTNGANNANAWEMANDADRYSGGKALKVRTTSEGGEDNSFAITVNIPRDGKYRIFMRVNAQAKGNLFFDLHNTENSNLFDGYNNGNVYWHIIGFGGTNNKYGLAALNLMNESGQDLTDSGAVTLKKGIYNFEVSASTVNDKTFKIDCLIITDDADFIAATPGTSGTEDIFADTAARIDHWYAFKEAEFCTSKTGADGANGGMTVGSRNIEGCSNKQILNFIPSAESDLNKRNRFSFDVDIPSSGKYTVWMKIYVEDGAAALNLVHTTASDIYKSVATSTAFYWVIDNGTGWYKLEVSKADITNTKTENGFISLAAGENTFEFSAANKANSFAKLYKFDCFIVTDDASFDPNTGDWEAVRDAVEVRNSLEANVLVGEDIAFNVGDPSGKAAKLVFTMNDRTEEVLPDKNGNFKFGGINPQLISDEFLIKAYDDEGWEIPELARKYSLARYFADLAEADPHYAAFCADMMVYSYWAQRYQNYKTGNLPDIASGWIAENKSEFGTDDEAALAEYDKTLLNGYYGHPIKGACIILGNYNYIRFRISAADVDSFELSTGNTVVEAGRVVTEGEDAYVYTEALTLKQNGQFFTLTVGGNSVSYCVNSYILGMHSKPGSDNKDIRNLCTSLYLVGADAAALPQ